ncbi:MAG: prepilin-type N-terminal cleavage/methylation domain-containing protein [Betaproteobacteria bacterium]
MFGHSDSHKPVRRAESLEQLLVGSNGFTLVEVLVALLLAAILLVPAMSSIAGMLTTKAREDVKAQALELARSTLEAIKALDSSSFSEDPVSPLTVTTPDGRASFDIERVMRVYDWDPSDPSNKLWEVTVCVYEHPVTDDATPLCSLTTLIYPQ